MTIISNASEPNQAILRTILSTYTSNIASNMQLKYFAMLQYLQYMQLSCSEARFVIALMTSCQSNFTLAKRSRDDMILLFAVCC